MEAQRHQHSSKLEKPLMKPPNPTYKLSQEEDDYTKASDALPLPLHLSNGVFFTIFFSIVYFLLKRWREKIRNSTPLHVVSLSEMGAIIVFFASFVYLLGFLGVDFVQSLTSSGSSADNDWSYSDDDDTLRSAAEDKLATPCAAAINCSLAIPHPKAKFAIDDDDFLQNEDLTTEDEKVVKSVVSGAVLSYSLESKLGNSFRLTRSNRSSETL